MNAPLRPRLADDAVPRLAAGARLQFEPTQQAWVVLFPEGMVKLNASAAEILQRCDGTRDVAAVVADLRAAFGDPAGLRDDVMAFFEFARERGWLALP